LKQTLEAAEETRKREQRINAEDPTLLPQLQRLLEEYELIAESDARWSEKAAHCDRIADCYLRMRDKANYQRWKLEAKAHRACTPNTGGFGTRQ